MQLIVTGPLGEWTIDHQAFQLPDRAWGCTQGLGQDGEGRIYVAEVVDDGPASPRTKQCCIQSPRHLVTLDVDDASPESIFQMEAHLASLGAQGISVPSYSATPALAKRHVYLWSNQPISEEEYQNIYPVFCSELSSGIGDYIELDTSARWYWQLLYLSATSSMWADPTHGPRLIGNGNSQADWFGSFTESPKAPKNGTNHHPLHRTSKAGPKGPVVDTPADLTASPLCAEVTINEIHSRHIVGGIPKGTPASNDLIFRDIYVLSSNDETKFADWVAYQLTPTEVWSGPDLERKWRTDPVLDEDETLEATSSKDPYKGLSDHYQRGHLAPLASFKGSRFASQANHFSNIVPQAPDLNQGPWVQLENHVRDIVRTGKTVWVITGPLYERDMPVKLNTDEQHTVPSGFWKVVIEEGSRRGTYKVSGYIMDQDAEKSATWTDFKKPIAKIEQRSGLDLFWRDVQVTE
jgi:endonuclease G